MKNAGSTKLDLMKMLHRTGRLIAPTFSPMLRQRWILFFCIYFSLGGFFFAQAAPLSTRAEIEQITHGPQHHFFGYIGQAKTTPWNASGRYIVALQSRFHDHMPGPKDAADVILIDTQQDNKIIVVDQTRAWNFQQGTMLYWNPQAPDTQFFFNDRDEQGRVFAVLYDIGQRKRIREYRNAETPVGNSGVAQNGKKFLAINYGRLARLRPVTGYPETFDWTAGQAAPDNDGIFIVDVKTGEKRVLVSYHRLAKLIRTQPFVKDSGVRLHVASADEANEKVIHPDISQASLYINHTLWNRRDEVIYFYLRGRRNKQSIWLDVPCTIKPDGSGLTAHSTYIGGHPEWAEGALIIGDDNHRQVLYDVLQKRIVGRLGEAETFPSPGGDIALSPNGAWFVNGYSGKDRKTNRYVFFNLQTGETVRTRTFSRGPYTRGDLRIDPAPLWNRSSDAVLVPGWTKEGARQLFVIRLDSLRKLGRIEHRRSESIKSSRWGMQFNKYKLLNLDVMLERMAESGVTWARVETRSYPVSPEDGYYKWAGLDSVIYGLRDRKINIFLTLDEKALGSWSRSKKPLDRSVIEAWLTYVNKLVARYHNDVKYWEILNEPKINENYVSIVKAASKAIKSIDPQAHILAGSLARVNAAGLEFLLDHGVGPYVDVITYHPYNEFPESCKNTFFVPVKTPEGYMQGGNLVADLRTLVEKEHRSIALWQGECGYPSAANSASWNGRGPWGEAIQAKWLLRRFLVDFSLDIPVSIYFLLREPQEGERINAKGLLHYGAWTPKPAFHALQNLTAIFDQRLNRAQKISAKIDVMDAGSFFGVRGSYPESYGAPYSNAKVPTPIEVFAATGSGGNAVVYWLPWRMQEIVKPARINLEIKDLRINDPVLVDLLSGDVYAAPSENSGNSIKFAAVPLTDYPFIIIDKTLLKIDK